MSIGMDDKAKLGRLRKVDPRTVWANEARDFTPWLLENADLLAETLGIDLQINQSEHRVGSFSCDLVGRDLANDAVLIVENQLDSTDHNHLGQLLTYAAGTDAATIVWIARTFREEHRQALDWLNEQTGEGIHFFGIEVELVGVDDEARLAPLLNVVAEPNQWQKTIRTAIKTGGSERAAMYAEFWTRFLERLQESHPNWSRARKPPTANWLGMPSPIKGAVFSAAFTTGQRLRHELYIDTGDSETTLELFRSLEEHREALEGAYGRELTFEELPGKRACRIAEYREGDVEQTDRHEEFIEWLLDAGERLRSALRQSSFLAS
ncbi:MAG: DUF4268 domain-containing protein [Thermoleophilia bacterium]